MKNIAIYVFSGGMGFLTNIVTFWILINYTSIWYVLASVISFLLSTFVGYNLHKRLTYSDPTKTDMKKLTSYYALNVVNILVNALLLYIFVEHVHLMKIASLIVSNLLISIYSYLIYKHIIFK